MLIWGIGLWGVLVRGLLMVLTGYRIEYIKPLLFRQGRLWNQKRTEEDIGVCR